MIEVNSEACPGFFHYWQITFQGGEAEFLPLLKNINYFYEGQKFLPQGHNRRRGSDYLIKLYQFWRLPLMIPISIFFFNGKKPTILNFTRGIWPLCPSARYASGGHICCVHVWCLNTYLGQGKRIVLKKIYIQSNFFLQWLGNNFCISQKYLDFKQVFLYHSLFMLYFFLFREPLY